jgi:hypothetical protein
MATTLQSLITQVRSQLVAPISGDNADEFWTDAEILAYLNNGIKDLWKKINDLYQHHFLTIDTTNVSTVAGSDLLTGVPANMAILRGIGPRSQASWPFMKFEYRSFDHKDFIAAQAQGTLDASQARLVYFYISQAGAPVAAPEIHIAPVLNAAVPLMLGYAQTLPLYTASDNNPIPMESDQALIDWGIAYARAKEREDRLPDPGMITLYATEKANLMVACTPRQTQDDEVAEGMFEGWE